VKSGRSIEIAGGGKPAPAKKSAAGTEQALKRLMAQYPEVQLATLVDQAPAGDKWVHEVKFDGYRLLVSWRAARRACAHATAMTGREVFRQSQLP
jgi:bifunctional non-homologous end joining protein LigD